MVRARLLISGRVQGVFYRASCREEASARGLVGWVRNLSDGSVEAVVQGTKEMIEDMIKWCYRGPRQAQVSSIDVSYDETAEEFTEFHIR